MAYDPDIHHRRSIRLKNYNYSSAGAYFITVCTQGRLSLFGEMKEDDAVGAYLEANAAGELMKRS